MKRAGLLAMFCACAGLVMSAAPITRAHASDSDGADDLRMVVVLSRHGVRSPTSKAEALDVFSGQPWPQWTMAPGYLTPHGKKLMALMGGWYRAYYSEAGLIPAHGCDGAHTTYVVADDEERTMESARGLMDGFLPGCDVTIRATAKSGEDALFSHASINVTEAERAEALAAVLGRVGGRPEHLAQANAGALATMQSVLLGCMPGHCTAAQTQGKKVLLDQENAIEPGNGDTLVSIKSPLHNASTFVENFVLEYTEDMPMSQVAWGRLSSLQLGQLRALHTAYSDIALRTAPIARAYAGNLAAAILATLQQGARNEHVDRAVGEPGAKLVFLVGHDTNITTLAGMLNLHWMLAEQPIDPTSTGGALVFELRRNRATGLDKVRVYYVSQSMEQMREAAPLSLQVPPQKVPVFVPGCGGSTRDESTPDYACSLSQFEEAVARASAMAPVTARSDSP